LARALAADPGSRPRAGVAVFGAVIGGLLFVLVSPGLTPFAYPSLGRSRFSWRDSVEFSDGTVVASTGHFVKERPPGLVVIAIIATLSRTFQPAIQKQDISLHRRDNHVADTSSFFSFLYRFRYHWRGRVS